MNFDEILKIKNDNFDIVLGYDENKELLEMNLKENPSIIITGSTGTSKSCLLHEILLQLINKNNYTNLRILPIAPTRVELNPYSNSNYSYLDTISENKESLSVLKIVGDLIKDRKRLFRKNRVKTFDEYNSKNKSNELPYIIIAIDEATDILEARGGSKVLCNLIKKSINTGIALIMNTNNVYNKFFKKDINKLASCRISFDFVTNEEDKLINLPEAHNLELSKFIVKIKGIRKPNVYSVIKFDDKYIDKVLNK